MDTLREQNQKGCDTSYVGGYVSLYQALILLCNLRKDGAISENNFNEYSRKVIDVLGSDDSSNIQAALLYATETCKKQNIDLPVEGSLATTKALISITYKIRCKTNSHL